MPLVRDLARLYTAGQSTSVTYETAQQLMGAALYCIREEAQAGTDPQGAESSGRENAPKKRALRGKERLGAEAAYRRGYELVIQKAVRAKELYEEIIPGFDAYKNRAYRETVAEGMPVFFLRYDARFCPQDHILTLDYPLLKSLGRQNGVDAVYEYLSCVRLEQRFLSALPHEYVEGALRQYHSHCEELLINVCGVVARNLMAHMIVGRKPGEGDFTRADLDMLQEFVLDKTQEERRARILFLLREISRRFGARGPAVFNYLGEDVRELLEGLSHAEGPATLAGLFGVSARF